MMWHRLMLFLGFRKPLPPMTYEEAQHYYTVMLRAHLDRLTAIRPQETPFLEHLRKRDGK